MEEKTYDRWVDHLGAWVRQHWTQLLSAATSALFMVDAPDNAQSHFLAVTVAPPFDIQSLTTQNLSSVCAVLTPFPSERCSDVLEPRRFSSMSTKPVPFPLTIQRSPVFFVNSTFLA